MGIEIVVSVVVAFLLGWIISSRIGKHKVSAATDRAKMIIEDAEKEAKAIKREKILEAKDEWLKKKQEFDNEVNKQRQKLQNLQKKLDTREADIDRKYELIIQKEKEQKEFEQKLLSAKQIIEKKNTKLDNLLEQQKIKLEKISQLTSEEAKKMLIENMYNKAKLEATQYVMDIREKAKLEAKKEAQKIIVDAIQRTAVDHSVETTVSVVQIQNDEMKGRIIGREGRNIRAFESATGVDVIVDDTPEAVILSSFDQYRREIAKIALERLIVDGRIHPARIEEIVAKVKNELEEEIMREGENTVIQLGIQGMKPELIYYVGKMKYRSSYGQNLLQHSIEVAYLTSHLASELNLDAKLAKRAGLLHDIGKVASKDLEGSHALIGYELAKKYNEHPIVVNAIGSHHEEMEMEHPIAVLVQAADAISGVRPGARREPLESYIKRLEHLEEIAQDFDGVAKTYAIQAGREIRVVVEPTKVDDKYSEQLAYDIAEKIENEVDFPGQIKVTVIREVRKISFAK